MQPWQRGCLLRASNGNWVIGRLPIAFPSEASSVLTSKASALTEITSATVPIFSNEMLIAAGVLGTFLAGIAAMRPDKGRGHGRR